MLKMTGDVFSLAGFLLAIYVVVMKDFRLIELMLLMFSLTAGVTGIEEVKKDHKGMGYCLLVTALLCLYSSIQGFLFFH
jgi:Protein of unknown function (DUF3953)